MKAGGRQELLDMNASIRPRTGVALFGFLAIAGFFLFTEHRAHLFGALPYLLILACPLLHIFGHGEHGGHSSHDAHDGASEHTSHGSAGGTL
jgi:hypothetical protein